MPYLDIRLANAELDDSARQRLARHGTSLLQRILGKRPELTAVSVTDVRPAGWMIGERSQLDSRRPAAHVEATITAGTNTAEQKAHFIAEMAALLKVALPGLHEATYVVVREIDAGDWGYDGVTQEARRQTPDAAHAPDSSHAQPNIRRSQSGAVDTEFYMAQAHRLRRAAARDLLRQIFAALRRLPVRRDAVHLRTTPLRPC